MREDPRPLYVDKDAELIKACLKDDRKAQYELYARYSGKFLGILYRYAPDSDTANDILQDAFIKIFRGLKKYKFTGSFEGWMRKIVVNTAIDYLNKNKAIRFENMDEIEHEIPTESEVLEKMNCEEIIDAISGLAPGYKTVLNLYAVEGYSYPEIAEMLKIREVSVRTQYVRARQKLAVLLENKEKVKIL